MSERRANIEDLGAGSKARRLPRPQEFCPHYEKHHEPVECVASFEQLVESLRARLAAREEELRDLRGTLENITNTDEPGHARWLAGLALHTDTEAAAEEGGGE